MMIIIKLILAILLFLCLVDMPYGYYQLVRFVALVGFGILAFKANEQDKKTEMKFTVDLLYSFNPFLKLRLVDKFGI